MTQIIPLSKKSKPIEKLWKIVIRDFITEASIGVHDHEKTSLQTIRINLTCTICMCRPVDKADSLDYVCYDRLLQSLNTLIASKHFHLVETLAEEISDLCLLDQRIQQIWVRVEKLDVYENIASVGIEIERRQ